MPSLIQLEIVYPNLIAFKGWKCGKSFISDKSRCFTDPITGKKLKNPLTYQEYKKERDNAITAKKSNKPLSSKDKYYLDQVEKDNIKANKKSIDTAIKATGATKLIPGNIGSVDPNKLEVDPKRFQYKLSASSSTGTVGSLKGVKKWDENLAGIIQVWIDPEDKKAYVVNGHNRVELEKRLGVKQRPARFLNAKLAKEARSIGALTNIAEGRGNSRDAAKFFRDSGISRKDLENRGVPLQEKVANDGLALSKLSDRIFNGVIQGEIPESRAVVIGSKLSDKTQQEALLKLIQKEEKRGRRITNDVVAELADMTSTAPKKVEGETNLLTLLGFDPEERSLAIEKAQITASIKRQLNKDKKLFGTVGKQGSAKQLKRGGNTINVEESASISQNAGTTLTLFDDQKKYRGKIDDVLNESASRLANGESKEKIVREAKEEIERELQRKFKYGTEKQSNFSSKGASRTHYYQTRKGKKIKVKYTKPKLREKLKQKIQASDKGGKPGQWSARKSQLLASEYKRKGGGYKGSKDSKARSLDNWTSQNWRTKDGKPAIRSGYTTRYLPDKEWDKLTEGQARATNRKKIVGSRKGKQFIKNTRNAKQ